MPDIKELKNKRGVAIKAARDIFEAAEKQDRVLTDEETVSYDLAMQEQADLQGRIERIEKQVELERTIAGAAAPDIGSGEKIDDNTSLMDSFRGYLQNGQISGNGAKLLAALQQDSDTAGGFTTPPEQFITTLIKAVDDLVFIRGLANVIPVTSGDSLGAPSLDNDPEDGTWSGEISAVDEDTQMSFGKRNLAPKLLAKLIKVSQKLMRVSALPIEQLVLQRLAYKFAITEEKAFLTGTGSGQPLGVFTASNDGIPTSRDVSTGNSTTAIAADNLREVKYSLKPGYMQNAQWIFHRDGVKAISKLKDGNGQYLWRPGLTGADPDSLLNMPLNMSEYAPNTFTTGLYVGILGDFSNYWIADSLAMQVQRLNELYAANSQVGFIARLEADGMPVLGEAFSRVTLA